MTFEFLDFRFVFVSLILDVFADSDEPEIILLYTEKKQYTDKDVIKITGLVSTLDSPTVLVGVYDPFGMPTGFYIAPINSDLESVYESTHSELQSSHVHF